MYIIVLVPMLRAAEKLYALAMVTRKLKDLLIDRDSYRYIQVHIARLKLVMLQHLSQPHSAESLNKAYFFVQVTFSSILHSSIRSTIQLLLSTAQHS